MFSRKLSVAAIAIAVLVAATTLLLGSFAAFNDSRERDRQWLDLRQELNANVVQLSAALALPAWNFDREQIDKVAESMMADQPTYGVIVEVGGKVQAQVRTDSWGVARLDHAFPTDGLLVEQRSITFAGEQIGRVTLCATTRFLAQRLRAAAISTGIVIALLDLLLIVTLYLLLWRVVLRPLVQIERFAGSVSSGSVDHPGLHGRRYWGELESVRASIAEMVGMLKARYAQLRESEERFSKIFVSTPAGISISSLDDGRLLDVNQEFERVFGYRRDEIIGRTSLELGLWRDPKDREEYVGLARATAPVRDHELHLRAKDGTALVLRSSAELIKIGNETLLLATFVDVTERKRAEEAREHLFEVVRGLARRLADVEEAERQRLSRELHDRVGQNLTALGLNLSILQSTLPPEAVAVVGARIDDSLALLGETVERVRDVMSDLRPPMLDDFGLLSALHWYAEKVASRTGLTIVVEGAEPVPRLAPSVAIALFRITQEALTNVVKHARAQRVEVTVSPHGEMLRLMVADDGAGFDRQSLGPAGEGRGWGLATMRERALAINGNLEIDSSPGRGTRILLECAVVRG
ncbi:MAG: PAS domain S-box protein [Thermoanaerobaculales bacterium]